MYLHMYMHWRQCKGFALTLEMEGGQKWEIGAVRIWKRPHRLGALSSMDALPCVATAILMSSFVSMFQPYYAR